MWKSMGMNHRQTHIDAQTNKRTKQNPKLSLSPSLLSRTEDGITSQQQRYSILRVCAYGEYVCVCLCARCSAQVYKE